MGPSKNRGGAKITTNFVAFSVNQELTQRAQKSNVLFCCSASFGWA